MQVSPINNKNCTPNFNGSVDKSIKKYVDVQVKDHIKGSLSIANSLGEKINKKDLMRIKENATTMMAQLDKFMGKMHPDTKLNFEKNYILAYPSIYLQNGKDKVYIHETITSSAKVSETEIYLKHAKPMYNDLALKKGDCNITMILSKMSNFINEFTNLNPKQIDEAMFTRKFQKAKFEISYFYNNESFFNFGFDMKKATKTFLNFAKDIGKAENAKSMIQEVKEKSKIEAKDAFSKKLCKQKEVAKIVKDNNNFVKDLLG